MSWSPTRVKFCQLIASLSIVLPLIKLTKLKLEYLKFGFFTGKLIEFLLWKWLYLPLNAK